MKPNSYMKRSTTPEKSLFIDSPTKGGHKPLAQVLQPAAEGTRELDSTYDAELGERLQSDPEAA